jgi:nitrite reductase/ring-hydroxylating ferredoxin subunit
MSHTASETANRIRVKIGDEGELPPGKGKTTTVCGREVTVYNREGRYVATATSGRGAPVAVETTCDVHGHHFASGPATSPDRLQSDVARYPVVVDGGAVYVIVEG